MPPCSRAAGDFNAAIQKGALTFLAYSPHLPVHLCLSAEELLSVLKLLVTTDSDNAICVNMNLSWCLSGVTGLFSPDASCKRGTLCTVLS